VDFKAYIHDIHLGTRRTPGSTSWYGSDDFTGLVRYPDTLANCQHCHLPGTNALPMAAPVKHATQSILITCNASPCTGGNVSLGAPVYTSPTVAVCTTCHDTVAAATHGTLMTINPNGATPQSQTNPTGYAESCDTCHGTGKAYDVAVVHAQ